MPTTESYRVTLKLDVKGLGGSVREHVCERWVQARNCDHATSLALDLAASTTRRTGDECRVLRVEHEEEE